MPCMVSETGLRLMPNRKDWQPEDTQVETAALTPAGCFLCGSTMGLVPSMYGPVCMECVLSDKQVGPNRASLLFTLFGDGRGRKVPA